MKTINIFFDFEFTSLSPDAQPISLGMVAEVEKTLMPPCDVYSETVIEDKTFYAEFSDFDITRCNDWVKENIVSKLQFNNSNEYFGLSVKHSKGIEVKNVTPVISFELAKFLNQFKDYQIQFVGDCVTFGWYHLLQLIGGWDASIYDSKGELMGYSEDSMAKKLGYRDSKQNAEHNIIISYFKHTINYIGIPILPDNISPIPQDLNDLIAWKKGISIKEAFELDRGELAFGFIKNQERIYKNTFKEKLMESSGFPGEKYDQKHNSLYDAKVTKKIFNLLKKTK